MGPLLPHALSAATHRGHLVPLGAYAQVTTPPQTTTPPTVGTPPATPQTPAPTTTPATAAAPTAPPPPKPPYTQTWAQEIVATEPLELAIGTTAVLLGAGESPLQARAVDDGRLLWTSALSPQGALVAEAGLVVFAAGGALQALDETSGAVRWRVPLDGPSSNVAVQQGRVLHAVGLEARAYDLPTGRELWRRALTAAPSTPFAFAVGAVFVMTSDQWLVALDETTGAERWRQALDLVPVSFATALDQIFIGTRDGAACAYQQKAGTFGWCSRLRMDVIGPPAAHQGVVYFALLDNTVSGLSASGTKVRSVDLRSRPIGGVGVAGELLVVTTAIGEVVLITAKTGRVTARLPAPGATETSAVSLEIAALSADTTRIASLVVQPGGKRTLALYSRTTGK